MVKSWKVYPFVWFERGGWWFKMFGQRFGPYRHCTDARHCFLLAQAMSDRFDRCSPTRPLSS